MFVALKQSSFFLPSWYTRVTSAHKRHWSKWSKRGAPFRGCSTVLHMLRQCCLFWRETLGARLARQRDATLIHIWCHRFIAADTPGSALKSIIYCPAWSNFKTISQSALRLETDTSIILGSSGISIFNITPKRLVFVPRKLRGSGSPEGETCRFWSYADFFLRAGTRSTCLWPSGLKTADVRPLARPLAQHCGHTESINLELSARKLCWRSADPYWNINSCHTKTCRLFRIDSHTRSISYARLHPFNVHFNYANYRTYFLPTGSSTEVRCTVDLAEREQQPSGVWSFFTSANSNDAVCDARLCVKGQSKNSTEPH